DTLARLGGDEFTILCENAGEQDAARVAGRVVRGLAEPFEYAGRALDLGASVGIRTTDSAEASAKELLREADIALYEAKRRGRGRLEIFDAHTRQRHGEHVKTEPALRSAVRDGQLRLHYQP